MTTGSQREQIRVSAPAGGKAGTAQNTSTRDSAAQGQGQAHWGVGGEGVPSGGTARRCVCVCVCVCVGVCVFALHHSFSY